MPIFRVKSVKIYTGQKNLHEYVRGVRVKYEVCDYLAVKCNRLTSLPFKSLSLTLVEWRCRCNHLVSGFLILYKWKMFVINWENYSAWPILKFFCLPFRPHWKQHRCTCWNSMTQICWKISRRYQRYTCNWTNLACWVFAPLIRRIKGNPS